MTLLIKMRIVILLHLVDMNVTSWGTLSCLFLGKSSASMCNIINALMIENSLVSCGYYQL
jgi:hypothetical protein